jgi:mannose-6-phosphate isomerase-like protein (cupin superfamily)
MSVAQIHKSESVEFLTPEGCWIVETWNDAGDAAVSVARARVQPGVTTKLHRLRGVVERYVIVSGNGFALIGGLEPARVGPGDVVIIPDGTSQQVVNDTAVDLIFYCICSPRFTPGCYEVLE